MKNYFTTLEAAKICSVSQGSMIRWIHEGKIPASVTPGGHHRIQAENLRSFLRCLKMPVPALLGKHGERFLIVSDHKTLSPALKRWMQSAYPGAKIEEAEEGFSAGWKASQFLPDLILVDFERESEGLHMCEAMRAFKEYETLPILVITQDASLSIQRKIASLGTSDWICKPLEKKSFLQKTRVLLQSGFEFKRTGS